MRPVLPGISALFLCVTLADAGTVRLVCNGTAGCPAGFAADGVTLFDSVESAVSAAKTGDTVLVWPGTYGEQVLVGTSDLTIRGMDRYGVVFEGDVDGDGNFREDKSFDSDNLSFALQAGNQAGTIAPENVTFENLSGTGYVRQPFFWVNVNGYFGRRLTAWDNGVYGVYSLKSTGDASNPSVFDRCYASGHSDGGYYIGECMPCNAAIRNSWAENNALGFTGTNAGGNLVLEDSEWNDNMLGILPNTLHSENDAPQRGAIIRNNLVHHNNNTTTPTATTNSIAPSGTGILVAGGWTNQIFGNTVHDNDRYGIGLVWLFVPPQHNAVFGNTLWGNGTGHDEGVDLLDAGPGSAYNCFQDNVVCPGGDCALAQEPSSDPPAIQTLSSCKSQVDPLAVQAAQNPVQTGLIVANGGQQVVNSDPVVPQPAPATPLSPRTNTDLRREAVSCMPNPCAGIDEDNLFCAGGEPVGLVPSPECAASAG